MNTNEINEKIQTRINEICETNRNRYRRQYPVTKWAREQLQALGLWEMVQNYRNGSAGQSDAQDILNDATTQVGGGFNADGEGESWSYTGEIGGLLKQLQAAQVDEKTEPTYDDPEIIVLSGTGGQQTALSNSRSMAFSSGSRLLIWKDGDEWFVMIDGISNDGNFYETDDYGPFSSRSEAVQFMEQFQAARLR